MKTNPKNVLVNAAAILGFGGIAQASKSPELAQALVNFDWDKVDGQESGEVRGDPTYFQDGPTTMLSKALANPDYAGDVEKIVRDHETAIVQNLTPALEQIRKTLGLRD